MITEFSFGKMVVDGIAYFDDLKIVEGKVVSAWWRKKGHLVQVEDIADILESKPNILVIGKGDPGLMKSSASLREFLTANGIELIEEKTRKAIRIFNELFHQRRNISAGFHVGC